MKKTVFIMALAVALSQGGAVFAESMGLDASLEIKADANGNAGGVDAQGSVEAGGSMEGQPEQIMDQGNGNAGVGSVISVEAQEVRGWDAQAKTEFMATVKSKAQLESGQDLENFAKGVLATDTQVKTVAATDNAVQVTYKLPAKFLGVFKTTLDATVDASFESAGSGTPKAVTVRFPWYRWFFALDARAQSSALTDAVNAAVDTQVSGSANVYARNGMTIQAISEVLNEVRAEVEANN